MKRKNVVEKADSILETLNPKYDMTCQDMREIQNTYSGSYDAIYCSFRFGYLQGMKAARSEMKRR